MSNFDPTATNRWRQQFTKANEHLRSSRDVWFRNKSANILNRLRARKNEALLEVAEEAVENGVYSRKINRHEVGLMILRRLWHTFGSGMPWVEFIHPYYNSSVRPKRGKAAASKL